jgi:hypothetical protein
MIEIGIGFAKGLGWRTDGKFEDMMAVEERLRQLGQGTLIGRSTAIFTLLPESLDLLLGHSAHLHAHVLEKDDVVSIGMHVGIGNDVRLRVIPHLFDFDGIVDAFGRGRDRPAALQAAVDALYRFVGHIGLVGDPPHAQEQHPQGVGAALVHQGARHHHIVHKVAGEEPVIRMDIRLGFDIPLPNGPRQVPVRRCDGSAACGRPAGEGHRQANGFKWLPKTGPGIPAAQGIDLVVLIRRVGKKGHQR